LSGNSKAVFISYASQDAEAAGHICEALRNAGIEVWFDQSELRGGDDWARQIHDRIRDCRLFLAIISAHTEARDEGYFRREWKLAVERTHDMAEHKSFLLPVAIDDTPERGASVPDKFHHVQWMRLRGGEATPAFVARVVALISAEYSRPGTPIGFGGNSSPVHRPPLARLRPSASIGIAAAVILIASGWLAWHYGKTRPPETPAPATSISTKSIAVLPFVDMSEKKDQEYFGDGMAEEILDLLTRVPGLTVIGRTSSFQFKGKNEDLRTIGTKLDAAYVLEGSVRRSGDQVRITAQLINTKTGAHEWSETYDRRIVDVLKLQDAISAAVARELQLAVASGAVNSRSTLRNPEAYDLILRGRHASDRWDQDGEEEAVTLLRRAIDRDPTSADASAELAFAYYKLGVGNFLTPTAAFDQARHAAEIAVRLDPKNSLAHYVLGKIHIVYDWDWGAATQEIQAVARLAPGSADALNGEARISLTLGRWDDALRQVKAALVLDPLDANTFQALISIQLGRRDLAEAEVAARRLLDIRPTYAWGHYYLGLILLERGDPDAALLEMEQERAGDPKLEGLAIVYHALGRKADSDAALARLIRERADEAAYAIAEVCAFRGHADDAIHWLERAYAQKDPYLVYLKSEFPENKLAADPRFTAFLRKMNLPE